MAVPLRGRPLTDLRLALVTSSERSPTVAVRAAGEHLKVALTRFGTEFGVRIAQVCARTRSLPGHVPMCHPGASQ